MLEKTLNEKKKDKEGPRGERIIQKKTVLLSPLKQPYRHLWLVEMIAKNRKEIWINKKGLMAALKTV